MMSFGGAWCCWELFTPVNVETVTESLFKLYVFYHKWAEWTAAPSERCILMCIAYTCVRRRRRRWRRRWYMAMLCRFFSVFVVALCCSLNLHYTNFSLFWSRISNMFHQHCKCFKRPSAALQTSMHYDSKRVSKLPFINALQLVALSTHKSIVYNGHAFPPIIDGVGAEHILHTITNKQTAFYVQLM